MDYGTGLDEFLEAYLRGHPQHSQEQGDRSINAAIHLALAYHELTRLKDLGKAGEAFRLNRRTLVLPALEQTWRELLWVRAHLPAEILEADIDAAIQRPVTLTRLGRIQDEHLLSRKSK